LSDGFGSLPACQRFDAKPCLNSFVVRRTIASGPLQTPTMTITYRANQDIKHPDRAHGITGHVAPEYPYGTLVKLKDLMPRFFDRLRLCWCR
jgi:hypothetical protein